MDFAIQVIEFKPTFIMKGEKGWASMSDAHPFDPMVTTPMVDFNGFRVLEVR